ncbi:class I SAM-dependent methyltransferase [Prochlorococcus marinus XMU1411]|uniref:class I SAM-dependent methyltransferase n=1 Tax=Prochlorococcus marinus TaxID=1219 RepID=UPI001ADCA2EB|nr:class I SAM-dependent methyltransferase [Prochlorococcus marinus]MBO8244209.1 class I SAM-dependent methyltransferase [Prochlorococcus marinus XMU1411]MBW3055294.1 hypothetical protein [Prochlorococcus marinus str. MU1411]MCR8537037.1 class I SAM-dependent methyltransferase [Prochlorococcus marinus CUG1430]
MNNIKYLKEDSYGYKKRIHYLLDYIKKNKNVKNVLEIGCGTGFGILYPLARHFKKISFVGEDIDIQSIEFANQKNSLSNLVFRNSNSEKENYTYDIIIISEVLEHVEKPQKLLLDIKSKLSDSGILFITIPNGYGPFEMVSTLMRILDFFKLTNKIRNFKRIFIPRITVTQNNEKSNYRISDTLADSPHINFFNFKDIKKLIYYSGYQIISHKNRTFICGDPIDILINKLNLSNLNSQIADYLPNILVSDWMFIVKKNSSKLKKFKSPLNFWVKFRRYLVGKNI